jgi:PAS domain S-box-containing protein
METADVVQERVLEAARFIPVEQLGTTDDCGFAPFCDDTSTSRDGRLRENPGTSRRNGCGHAASHGQLMHADADDGEDVEASELQRVALRNAHSILQARNRADEDLRNAKAALERRTDELDRSLTLMQATLDSTADGILVTDASGRVVASNDRFLQIWGVSAEQVGSAAHADLTEHVGRLFTDPGRLKARIQEIYAGPGEGSLRHPEPGRWATFERVSRSARQGRPVVGAGVELSRRDGAPPGRGRAARRRPACSTC